MTYKLVSSQIHGLFNASIYPLISWAGVVPAILAYRIEPLVPRAGLVLLILGGLVYMLGFVIYYRRWPDPWPGVFGHHEIWHIFVMGGSLLHYIFVLFFIALM
jgi:hemolysin III